MALVTAPQPTLPDYEHEYHTIIVDTADQVSKNTFSVYLQQPLENVVQVRLTAAQIHTSSSNVCHISIDELNTNFSQRATSDLDGQSSVHSYVTVQVISTLLTITQSYSSTLLPSGNLDV
jgi:hypothetical protein